MCFALTLLVALIERSAAADSEPQAYDYGTQSIEARAHFIRGWQQILDYGQWTDAERSFRKAVEVDPHFVLGKSLIGRISRDLEERRVILAELEAEKESVDAEGRLLLDIFMPSIQAMNDRDQGVQKGAEHRRVRRVRARADFAAFLKKHPEESYIRAEYVETIHALDGAKAAITAIQEILTPSQRTVPFFVGYRATLEAELGNHDRALELAKEFDRMLGNPRFPQPYMIYAGIYAQMGRTEAAKQAVDKAVELDDQHLIAQAMKARFAQAK